MTSSLPPKDKPTLLSCPWCGHAEALEIIPRPHPSLSPYVHCSGCGCEGPYDSDDAIEAWNTRSAMNAARTPITGGGGDAPEWLPTFKAFVAELDNHEAVTIDCDSVMHMVLRCAVAALTAKLNSEALVEALEARTSKTVSAEANGRRYDVTVRFSSLADAHRFDEAIERGEG